MSRIEEMIRELCPNGVEYKPLGDVCFYPKTRIAYSSLTVNNYVSTENLLRDKKVKQMPAQSRMKEWVLNSLLEIFS